jgi:MarR family transcriptional regulator for hemolysin
LAASSGGGKRSGIDGFGPLLGEVARMWRLRLDERLRPLGLSQARWVALYRLARLPAPPAQGELATLLGVEGPTVARLLDSLESAGYVVRRPTARDRRIKVIKLTARARREAARIDHVAMALRHELLADLDGRELKAATRLLRRLRRRLGPPAGGRQPRAARQRCRGA